MLNFESPMVQIEMLKLEMLGLVMMNLITIKMEILNLEMLTFGKEILGLSYTNTPCVVKNITLTLSATSL